MTIRFLYWVLILSMLSPVLTHDTTRNPFKSSKDLAAARALLLRSRWLQHPLFPKISRPKNDENVDRLWMPYYSGIGKGR